MLDVLATPPHIPVQEHRALIRIRSSLSASIEVASTEAYNP